MIQTSTQLQAQPQPTYGPKCHDHGITGYGSTQSGICFLGIAPGRTEISTKRPFTGAAGRVLDTCLSGIGINRADTYATNLVCYWNDSPDVTEIAACRERLQEELTQVIKPKVIVGFGELVANQLLPAHKMGQIRGCPIWHDELNAWVLITYHPAACFRKQSAELGLATTIFNDLHKLTLILDGHYSDRPQVPQFYIMNDVVGAQCVLDTFIRESAGPIALDIETGTKDDEEAIDIFKDKFECLALSDGKRTWVFDLTAEQVGQLDWPRDVTYLYQNGMFDVNGLRQFCGIDLPIHKDSLLHHYAYDERKGHGLDRMSAEYSNAPLSYKTHFKQARKRGTETRDDLFTYNACDAYHTWWFNHAMGKLEPDSRIYPFLIQLSNMFAPILYRGTRIDVAKVVDLASRWIPAQEARLSLAQGLARSYGWEGDINFGSPKQLSKLLYQTIGLPGGPSTDKEHLDLLDHPMVDVIHDVRQGEYMNSHYILGILDDIKRDGRCHPHVMLHGTVTGRPTYSQPPLQTIPQRTDEMGEYAEVRSIFAATNDDYVLVEADYSQIELWFAQILSGDRNMYLDLTTPFLDGKPDYHGRIAQTILHADPHGPAPTWKGQRIQAKKVDFGILYGESAVGLSSKRKGTGLSVRENQSILNDWYAYNSGFALWQAKIRAELKRSGVIETPFGRKRRLYLAQDGRQLRQAVNSPIQGTASDWLLHSALVLHEALRAYDSYINLTVHDSIVFEIAVRFLPQALNLIKEVMLEPKLPGYPSIPIDIHIGHNLYDMEAA